MQHLYNGRGRIATESGSGPNATAGRPVQGQFGTSGVKPFEVIRNRRGGAPSKIRTLLSTFRP
jgi:hypothetical protein